MDFEAETKLCCAMRKSGPRFEISVAHFQYARGRQTAAAWIAQAFREQQIQSHGFWGSGALSSLFKRTRCDCGL